MKYHVNIYTFGDTRRFRYRTNIVVGNLLRYFDTMVSGFDCVSRRILCFYFTNKSIKTHKFVHTLLEAAAV